MAKQKKQNGEGTPVAQETHDSQKIRFGLRMKFTLAIISLVAMILGTMTIYFVYRESDLLRKQVFASVQREMVHLANTAQESIGVDELAIIAAIKNLQKIDHFNYAFILNQEGQIIQYFDRRKENRAVGEKLADGIKRGDGAENKNNDVSLTDFKDPVNPRGKIYDFSKVILNKLDGKPIGTVILGLSDKIIREEVANVIKVISLISLVFLGLSIVGAIILATITIKPIRMLSQGVMVIGGGNLDHRIEIHRSDELGMLAREFNDMTTQIKSAKDQEIESRLMEEQLDMAKDIQEGLNPMGYYDKNGIQIKGFTRAAKGVGGDYFDYIDIDDYRVGALISDVSGKGVPASLVMVMIRTVFTSYVTRGDVDCASVVSAINDSLSADFAIDKFATLFFMIYDRKTGELAFSNAGHGPLFCYRSDIKACTATKLDGVPIGIMDDVEYVQAKVKMNPGDMIVLYTDGVTEMRNSEKEEYGLKRVQEMMLKNHHLNAEEFVELLVNDVDDFRGEVPPHDDETMLVFKRVE